MRTLLLSEKLLIILKIININSLVIIIIFPLKKKKNFRVFFPSDSQHFIFVG